MADKLYNTLHIFGFGKVQVIGTDFNYQVDASLVQMELDPCINNVYDNKPNDSTTPKIYHAINVFNELFADWLAKGKDDESFRVEYSNLDPTLFDALALAVKGFYLSHQEQINSTPIVEPPLPPLDAPTT
jgi:hypothetical protein